MSTAVAQIAKGITVSFANLVGDLVDIDDCNFERPSVDVTHQQSGDFREKLEGAFIDQMPIVLVMAYHYSVNPVTLISSAASSLVVTYPVPSGLTNGAVSTVNAFCTKVARAGKLGEKSVFNVEITPKGTPSHTAAS